MKTMALLPAAIAAMLAFGSSGALSQEVCSKEYVSCVDACVTKRSDQNSCFGYCQQKNEQCSVKIFGARQPASSTAQQPSDASEALAKRSAAPAPLAPAPRQIQAPAPRQVQAPAPRQIQAPALRQAPARPVPALTIESVPPAAPPQR